MKKLIFFMLILSYSFGFSQYEKVVLVPGHCRCSIFPPAGHTMRNIAKKRFLLYGNKKKSSQQLTLGDQKTYSTTAIETLFEKVTSTSANYDGLRIYFASYPSYTSAPTPDSGYDLVPTGQYDSIALIFVPTSPDSSQDTDSTTYHADDLKNCWTILGDQVKVINADVASRWIKRARNQYLKQFDDDGKSKHFPNGFYETNSLWYPSTLIASRGLSHNGLIDYLQCRICCKDIDAVILQFGAFLLNNQEGYKYQLNLVFNYHKIGGKKDIYFTFSPSTTGSGQLTDTGKPCPPPNGPNGCAMVGALLPTN